MTDNKDMADSSFSQAVIDAVEAKTEWYDKEELPNLLEQYRLLHTCVKNIFEFLVKKSLITPDPYKLDKKISDIKAPENSNYTENERALTIGMRFSDYESTLDFLCNYYKFSVSNLVLPNIKKLVDLNAAFVWNQFTPNSVKPNTRGLAELVLRARQNADALTQSMVTDSLSKASRALTEITRILKGLADFQKEYYKGQVRKNVFSQAGFDANKALQSPAEEMAQIKKHFTAGMGKTPFYNDLVDELIREDTAPNKADLQQAVLAKLNVESHDADKKKKEVDTKDMIMGALRVLGALPPQLEAVLQKVQENHDILESEHNSLGDKIKRLIQKAFNLPEKPLFYNILISDASTEAKRRERINFQQFTTELATRSRRYASCADKGSQVYANIAAQKEEKILEFVTNQLAECNKTLKILAGLDDFFKQAAAPENKSKIKGVKMEITSIKNCVVKANQVRAEYAAYVEEEAQMRKLGITNEG